MTTKEQKAQQKINQDPIGRVRPRWATRIHYLGDDIAFACRGWNDMPIAVRRTGALAVGLAGGKAAGIDDVVDGLIQLLE